MILKQMDNTTTLYRRQSKEIWKEEIKGLPTILNTPKSTNPFGF
ncbi:hypothetical protein [Labilibaculum filiforme]|nr:hypothetical protein [Labilibaculum filiforme]